MGLITYFYIGLSIEISYLIPDLNNNYKSLQDNYKKLENIKENNEFIPLSGNFQWHGDMIIDNQYILKNINIDTKKILTSLKKSHGKIGIIGLSGSGKSSLLKILMGIESCDNAVQWEAQQGYIDNISQESYKNNIIYINQNKFIMEDTLYNNLCLSDKFDEKKAQNILKILNIDKNLHDEINDNNISGGEKARINIARSLLNCSHPSLIIMDELEASLDKITYENIYKYINKEYKNLNIIMTTHDTETIKNLDYIIFLDGGGKWLLKVIIINV